MKRAGYRFLRTFFSPFIRIIWPTKVIGKQNIVSGEKVLYISNHYSALDPIPTAVHVFKKDFNVMIKDEAYQKAKWFFDVVGAIPVKREENDISAVKQSLKILNAERPLLIYPEGTRNQFDSKTLLPFKSGPAMFALKTKAKVVPILLYRSTKVFRKNYMFIGAPLDLSAYYDEKVNDVKDAVTTLFADTLNELRKEAEQRFLKKNKALEGVH